VRAETWPRLAERLLAIQAGGGLHAVADDGMLSAMGLIDL